MNENCTVPGENSIGFTTTLPVEIILAAGLKPVDLNNLFVSSDNPQAYIDLALEKGFPQGTCSWLKGIFGAVVGLGAPRRVIGVVRGDCSGTQVLLEALDWEGVEVIPFSFPLPKDEGALEREMVKLSKKLGTSMGEAEKWISRLRRTRENLWELDRLCWKENKVSGLENHSWLVSSSDFWGEPLFYTRKLEKFIESVNFRDPMDRRSGLPFKREIRLGYVGVPPIDPEIFSFAESLGARFVFLEVQRQYSMPFPGASLVGMYLAYTYPYSVRGRCEDINRECKRRGVDGIIHYVQSFCYRNLEDVIFSERLETPMITIEADCPGGLSAPARSRLENFIQVLGENI
ncbi:MAG: 2-hydroxyacyl-CoA dehydratase family protein [Actinomycetota bacterium]|nr:2-hydroxyacyl-CoA dehydratase family protein [Actinomycetota bacterium]